MRIARERRRRREGRKGRKFEEGGEWEGGVSYRISRCMSEKCKWKGIVFVVTLEKQKRVEIRYSTISILLPRCLTRWEELRRVKESGVRDRGEREPNRVRRARSSIDRLAADSRKSLTDDK